MKSTSTTVAALPPSNDVRTYRRIRKAIGILAFSLPLVLVIFSLVPFFQTTVQESISHYYFTNLRELFTGVLCAVGLFLCLYKGHTNTNIFKNDSLLTNIAGVLAFGIALMPTSPLTCTDKIYTIVPLCLNWLAWLHFGFAGVFFLVLSIISINVFTIGQVDNQEIPVSMLNENHIYRACGYSMLVFIVLTPVCDYYNCFRYSTLIFETLMLIAFGISWLIKGRALGDSGTLGKMIYREDNA